MRKVLATVALYAPEDLLGRVEEDVERVGNLEERLSLAVDAANEALREEGFDVRWADDGKAVHVEVE